MLTEQRQLESSRYPLDITYLVSREYTNIHSIEELYGDATSIAQMALFHWNNYLTTNDEVSRHVFLVHAHWLIEHEVRIGSDAGGWPVIATHPDSHIHAPWLSALTQGCGISVLVRAFMLTHEHTFFEAIQRVVHTFEMDILDGGVTAPVGKEGIFFEEIAVYPASHSLKGFLFGVLGLYDYVNLCVEIDASTQEMKSSDAIKHLLDRSLATLHKYLQEFDTEFWTCSDLLYRPLSSRSELTLQATLLDALATYSKCEQCSTQATRWRTYQQRPDTQLHYFIARLYQKAGQVLLRRIRTALFRQDVPATERHSEQNTLRVCVPISAFPVTGGMRSVLFRIIEVTRSIWQLEYVTHTIGPNTQEFLIHRFGTRRMSPWQFPAVWFYTAAGFLKLLSLLRNGTYYDVVLLQDGMYTAAFGGLVAKLAGVRSVCIDHGNLSVLRSSAYRAERIKTLENEHYGLPRRLLAHLQYTCYWPSLSLLAKFSTHFIDHYFIPGAIDDGVEEVCRSLGILPSRISRFVNMIETERHIIPDITQKLAIRSTHGIASDAIVIAIICRLAPEKGLEITLEAISRAISMLPSEVGKRLHIILAGDGPLRAQIEEDIRLRHLNERCLQWGEASQEEVIKILGLSDIFLFTSWRAAGYPLTVLEAMASACAVIASTESLATQEMLAEGRGVIVPVGNVAETANAIVQLASNPERCREMGRLARNYVEAKHSPDTFRRSLLRVTYWSSLDQLL